MADDGWRMMERKWWLAEGGVTGHPGWHRLASSLGHRRKWRRAEAVRDRIRHPPSAIAGLEPVHRLASQLSSAAPRASEVPGDRVGAGAGDQGVEVEDRDVGALIVVHPDRLERLDEALDDAERAGPAAALGADRVLA